MLVFLLYLDDTEEVRRLGMGRLLSDVAEKMHAKADEGSHNKLKLLVHSTHDTSLAGICKTLEVFDDRYVYFRLLIYPLERCRQAFVAIG